MGSNDGRNGLDPRAIGGIESQEITLNRCGTWGCPYRETERRAYRPYSGNGLFTVLNHQCICGAWLTPVRERPTIGRVVSADGVIEMRGTT